MSRQLQEIEAILGQLIDEHAKLLGHMDAQQSAMRGFKLELIEQSTRQHELSRLRIAGLEKRRRMLAGQIARAMRMAEEPTVTRLAELFPARAQKLRELRDQLRAAIEDISLRSSLASRVAGAMLGHLNSAVRVVAAAVEQAGIYTKSGSPQMSKRIGVMEAVG